MLRFCLQGFTRLYKVYPEMCFTSDLLKQDNIVRFIDDDASKREITTEYITGKSLDQYVGNIGSISGKEAPLDLSGSTVEAFCATI